jgi:Uma2 family endonuclease
LILKVFVTTVCTEGEDQGLSLLSIFRIHRGSWESAVPGLPHDQYRDVLLNPVVLIEVVSPTTEAFDRGDKFFRYRTWLPSLSDYILVAQATPLLDHFQRQPHGHWELSSASGLASSLSIASIACTLRLADVYERIAFPPEVLEAYPEEPPSA